MRKETISLQKRENRRLSKTGNKSRLQNHKTRSQWQRNRRTVLFAYKINVESKTNDFIDWTLKLISTFFKP